MNLTNLPIGEKARVVAVNGKNAIAKRLMEMGVVPGVLVRVVKSAPFGDPLEISVRGYHLAMRKNEAEIIEVQILDSQITSPKSEI
ncbi:MAG: FeoA family protein [Pyrinomonadaceae bacterium]